MTNNVYFTLKAHSCNALHEDSCAEVRYYAADVRNILWRSALFTGSHV